MNISIVTGKSAAVSLADAAHVAAAIQQQILRDVAPAWGVTGVISASPGPQIGFVPVILVDTPLPGALSGFHTLQNGLAYAVVRSSPDWSIIASHEIIEMMIDPGGNQFHQGRLPGNSGALVNFLMEVCDPCQHKNFAYPIGDVLVSDFVFPNYWDEVAQVGKIYSHTRSIATPKEVLPGGSICWIAGNNHAYQFEVDLSGKGQTLDRGPYAPGPMPAREYFHSFGHGYGHILKGGTTPHQRTAHNLRKANKTASSRHAMLIASELEVRTKNAPRPKRTRKASQI